MLHKRQNIKKYRMEFTGPYVDLTKIPLSDVLNTFMF